MQDFKLEIFEKEHHQTALLFNKVDGETLITLLKELRDIIDKNQIADSIDFFKSVNENLDKALVLESTDDLNDIFNKLEVEVPPSENCYIIWDFPEDIDQFDLSYLKLNWNYVWYADSDDAVVLYVQDRVLMLITHYGTVRYRLLKSI